MPRGEFATPLAEQKVLGSETGGEGKGKHERAMLFVFKSLLCDRELLEELLLLRRLHDLLGPWNQADPVDYLQVWPSRSPAVRWAGKAGSATAHQSQVVDAICANKRGAKAGSWKISWANTPGRALVERARFPACLLSCVLLAELG